MEGACPPPQGCPVKSSDLAISWPHPGLLKRGADLSLPPLCTAGWFPLGLALLPTPRRASPPQTWAEENVACLSCPLPVSEGMAKQGGSSGTWCQSPFADSFPITPSKSGCRLPLNTLPWVPRPPVHHRPPLSSHAPSSLRSRSSSSPAPRLAFLPTALGAPGRPARPLDGKARLSVMCSS